MPQLRRNAMSVANSCRRVSLVMALPPYLTTTILPCSWVSHGKASANILAFAWVDNAPAVMTAPDDAERSDEVGAPPACGGKAACSRRVCRILFNVAVRQVGGADGCLAVAHLEVDEDVDIPT